MTPRPPRTNRDAIVSSATELLDTEGVEAFSMRRLGQVMGLDPMTIYHHVPNKAALFDAVVDRLWSSIEVPESGAGTAWQTTVSGLAHELRRTLLAHPRLIPLVGTRPAVTPLMLALLDRMTGSMTATGLASDEALQLLDCVVAFVVGKTQGELREPVGGTDTTLEDALATLTPETHPHLVRALSDGYDWSPDVEFSRGVEALVSGWTGTR